jgi:hypothetical protein
MAPTASAQVSAVAKSMAASIVATPFASRGIASPNVTRALPPHRDAPRRGLDQRQYDHAIAVDDACRDDQAIGDRRVEHGALLACKAIPSAIAGRACGDLRHVVACIGFAVGERQSQRPVGNAGKQAGLLFARPRERQEPRTQSDGRDERLDHERLAKGLHRADELDRTAAYATEIRRQGQAKGAELGKRTPDLGAEPRVGSDDSPACFERVVLAEKALERRSEELLLLVEIEVHEWIFD